MAKVIDQLLGVKLMFDANNANSAMDKTGRHVHKMAGSFDALSMNMWRVQMGFQQLTQAITLPALAAAGAIGVGVKAVADWETGLAHVASTMPKAVVGTSNLREAIRLFGDDVEKTSIRFGFSMADTTKGLYDLIGAGVATGDASEFMKLASEAAVAGYTDVRFATDALTTVVNAYGNALGTTTTALQKASYVSDIMFASNRLGKTEFIDMAKYVGITASSFAELGIEFRELMAMSAVMSAHGRRPRSVFTDLAQAALSIARPTAGALQQAKRELPELLEYVGEGAIKKHGLQKSLVNILRLTEGRTFEGQSALAIMTGSLAGFKTAAFFADKGAQEFTDAMTIMGDAGGTTRQIFMDTSQILSHNFNRALQVGITVMRRFGRGFLDAFGIKGTTIGVIVDRVEENLDAIQSIARRFFGDMRRGFQELRLKERILGVAGALDHARSRFEAFVGSDAGGKFWRMSLAVAALTAALSPALLLLTPFILGISGIVTIIGGMAAILAPIGGLIAAAFSPAVLPWILGIAAAALIVYMHFDSIKRVLGRLGDIAFPVIRQALSDTGAMMRHALLPVFMMFDSVLSSTLGKLAEWGLVAGFTIAFKILGIQVLIVTTLVKVLATAFLGVGWAIAKVVDAFSGFKTNYASWFGENINRVWSGADSRVHSGKATNLPWEKGPQAVYRDPLTGAWETIPREAFAERSLVDQLGDLYAKFNKPPSAEETKAEDDKRLADFKAVAEDVLRRMGINVNTSVNLDGKQLASAMGRTSMEISERGGGRIPPWQRARVNAGRAVYSTTPGY